MTDAWLSRVRLRRDAGLAALGPLLMPAQTDARIDASHRLVWTLFADVPDRRRDFLWREEAPGQFLVLSQRPPALDSPILEIDSKRFEPALEAGDRLAFMLRANPTVTPTGADCRRSDVVMHAIHRLPTGQARAAARPVAIQEAGSRWLVRLGERNGFAVQPERLAVDGYELRQVPRILGDPMKFGQMDFQGMLTVVDAPLFRQALLRGFGRAKAFGCGLMLIRRV